jgi:hypothetical protein
MGIQLSWIKKENKPDSNSGRIVVWPEKTSKVCEHGYHKGIVR